MFHIISFRDIPVIEKQRAVLIIYKNDEDGKGVMQRTKQQLVTEGLTAMVTEYVVFLSVSIWHPPRG